MQKVTVKEFKAKFSSYLKRMKEGEHFVVNGVIIGKFGLDHKELEKTINNCLIEIGTSCGKPKITDEMITLVSANTFNPIPKSKSIK